LEDWKRRNRNLKRRREEQGDLKGRRGGTWNLRRRWEKQVILGRREEENPVNLGTLVEQDTFEEGKRRNMQDIGNMEQFRRRLEEQENLETEGRNREF
jgi:hypothetical protein